MLCHEKPDKIKAGNIMTRKFKNMVKLITVCATCFLVIMVVVVFAQQIKIKNLARKETALANELAQLQSQKVSLEKGVSERESDAYIEKEARDRLKLIADNEVIYIYE